MDPQTVKVELSNDDLEIIATALQRWKAELDPAGYTAMLMVDLCSRLDAAYDQLPEPAEEVTV